MLLFLSLLSLIRGQNNFYSTTYLNFKETAILATLEYQGLPSPAVIQKLNVTVTPETYDRVRVQIKDYNSQRWEVPDIVIPSNASAGFSKANYTVTVTNTPFGLEIVRKSDGKSIFNIDPDVLFQYNDQDIIMTTSLSYPFYVYGIGERVTNFPVLPGIYTLFSRDFTGEYDDGKPPGKNMYSSQPMFIGLDNTGTAHGGFLLNSNAMDVNITSNSVTFRTIGGIIDYFAFVGPSPELVVKQYQDLVGRPVLTPYWGLGYHQCRWGYRNLSDLQAVVTNFNKYRIPLDALWTDIDYMLNYEDFTLDPSRYNYADFSKFIDSLHAAGRRFVPITDAAIALQNYSAYNEGLEKNVYIQSPNHPGALLGSVWPGSAVYIDWFNPNATTYWHDMMSLLRDVIKFDGFWVDMNEPSNFCNGECGYDPSPLVQKLPYTPGVTEIDTKTIDLGGLHYGGILEYDVHNLYGYKMSIASASYFTNVLNTRPFVISRSSFAGHGRYASKWLGDNFSQYDWMKYSIAGIFNFQIFGIPLIGADICGFNGNTTEELCCRWYQLGTLYPFSRNHNTNDSVAQEPWAFGQTLLDVSNNAIRIKYSLINYFYTLMFYASLEGGTVFKPTFFEYPHDQKLQFLYSQDNFMLGSALLVHPVLAQGVTQLNAYFPSDIWYDWYTGKKVVTSYNKTLVLDAPLNGNINIHVRGGYIIPKNDLYTAANTVEKLRSGNITLIIALDGKYNAKGRLVLDDGISLGTIENGNFTAVEYKYSGNTNSGSLEFNLVNFGYKKAAGEWPYISQLVFYGTSGAVKSVFNNGNRVDYYLDYDSKLKVATAKINTIIPDNFYQLVINY
jgi:alpha-glucosidase (family GH31 glycosyl hydrolase)